MSKVILWDGGVPRISRNCSQMFDAIFAAANVNLMSSDNTSMANMFSMPQRKMQTI
jgi:hypothetical protein